MPRALKAVLVSVLALFAAAAAPHPAASQPSGEEILRRVDANMQVDTAHMRARMTVRYREGDERVMEFESWSRGEEKAFIEFTAPARDAGSRFLRIEDVMWYYLPRVGKSVRIQGHMLRQGMMGSDFSYGDATENASMVEDYRATVEGDTTLSGRRAWVLFLEGQREDLSYPTMRVWIDAERYVPLREHRFARSGKLLKTATFEDVQRLEGRWMPLRTTLDNALQADTLTILQILELELGVEVPERYFTLRHLEGGR